MNSLGIYYRLGLSDDSVGIEKVRVVSWSAFKLFSCIRVHRKRAYKKEFGKQVGNKAAILPGVL